jgi:hypothetical protein
MKVEIWIDEQSMHHEEKPIVIDMPVVPCIGDEVTFDNKEQDLIFFEVSVRDFVIKNGAFDKIQLTLKDL